MILRRFLVLALLSVVYRAVYTQVEKPDSVIVPVQTVVADSAVKPANNATRSVAGAAAKDTTPRFAWIPPVFRAQHTPPFNPDIAWKRALLFPGAGQVYNRSYWKVPIVYAGLGGLGFWIWYNNKYYQSYNKAFISEYNGENILEIDVPFGVETVASTLNANDFRNARDASRKSRDQAILFFIAGYGLSAVEAYVDAHLKSFDVGEDLSFSVSPGLLPTSTAFSPAFTATPSLRLVIRSGKSPQRTRHIASPATGFWPR